MTKQQAKKKNLPSQKKVSRKPFYQVFIPHCDKQKTRSTDPLFKKSTHDFLNVLYKDILHHKQMKSLRLLVMGVLFSTVLGIAAVGRAMAKCFGTLKKHGIKQIDRHLSETKVELATFYSRTVQLLIGKKKTF